MAPALSLPAQTRRLPLEPPPSSRRQPPANHLRLRSLKKKLLRITNDGQIADALSTVDLMSERGIPPDLRTYTFLLRSCIRCRDLRQGRVLHRRILLSDLPLDSVVFNSLITLYSKCGVWDSAVRIFNQMASQRDIVSWTALISSAVGNKMESRALSIFIEMLEQGFIPNEFTISSVSHACSNPQFIEIGRVILGFALKTGFLKHNASVSGALIDMFAKSRDLTSARKVFDAMLEKNAVIWTLLITRYSQHGLGRNALKLFVEMISDDFNPDQFSISSAISACTDLDSVRLGQQLHSLSIRAGLVSDVCVSCSLVDMYAKCSKNGSMDDSRRVFDNMPDQNVMSWTAIISGYVQSGKYDDEAITLFLKMMEGRVRPNHFTYSSILKACSNLSNADLGQQIYAQVIKFGLASVNVVGNSLVTMFASSSRMEEARKAFEALYEKNLVSYNALVDGYVKNSNSEEAFEIFHQSDFRDLGSSPFTFASLLSAAASIGVMSKGQKLHGQVLKMGFECDICICNALISMYSRCGNIDDASLVFFEMRNHNVISWTSMIAGFAKNGDANSALQLFNDMVSAGITPNDVTYTAVLSACSHVGFVREGWEHFHSMKANGLAPRMEHFACMVDLLGRSGRIEEAFEFISSMPFKADSLVWKTLLGACRTHQNFNIGEIAARNIIELEPNDPAAYVLLSNLYAAVGWWEDAGKIRSKLKEKKLNKEAGLSWMEVDNRMHKFHVGDTSHPQAKEIFKKLGELVEEIKGIGYVPDTDCVLHDVGKNLKEQYLLQHSEKIAVAFGLLTTSPPRPIRIYKNLRVCGDCHNAIGYVTMVTSREIIVRDSNRFHRFRNGECSCGGYW
ncbi:Pentatricopeptide repeat-containing protein [Apostasia shenzhenica]|uniref:Pentatricopeptide repeat-containing protein n=1 Tax=Apostasia shenzhenica TaxID=1088818 RepID=A0A2I0AEZ2_9ASPA|nr:Pentatricopeptide repeat-containing protein [Apostasia shenzhenica]